MIRIVIVASRRQISWRNENQNRKKSDDKQGVFLSCNNRTVIKRQPHAMQSTSAITKLSRSELLLLFDVDGTLTASRADINPKFESFIYEKIKPLATLALVGGSDFEKIAEQLNGERMLSGFDFVFPENGLIQFENGKEVGRMSIHQHLGEENLQRFINFTLRYLSELTLPVKRGTFIDFRNGMINVCPIGRQCSREQRNSFEQYDKVHGIRQQMIDALRKEFHDVDLVYSIGGQISFDVFPHGWDKTYCLGHLTQERFNFREIHFFGDKTDPGGNDYEIFRDSRTIGHKVESPDDTRRILEEMFGLKDSS